MSIVTCKNQRVLDSARICCFDSESIQIKYSFNNDNVLNVIFNFHYDNDKTRYSVHSSVNGVVDIDVYNFTSPYGTGLKNPQPIAKFNEKTISIVFFITLLKEANPILDYSIYMEE